MALLTEKKQQIIKQFQLTEGDTGSPEVQIALLSASIEELTGHMKTHKKDFHSRRGLLTKVNSRRSLLKYLKKTDSNRYTKLIEALGLRK